MRARIGLSTMLGYVALAVGSVSGVILVLVATVAVAAWVSEPVSAEFAAQAVRFGVPAETGRALAAWIFLLVAVVTAAFTMLMILLSRIALTVRSRGPFSPANVRRLYLIAACLVAMELGGFILRAVVASAKGQPTPFDVNVTVWAAILIVLVIAEVFAEGVRLKTEAEMTI